MHEFIESIARPNILKLHPYRCARDDYNEGVLLDANENAIGPTATPVDEDNHLTLERYPCPYQVPLKTQYANYRNTQCEALQGVNPGLKAENFFVGVGSDEAIDLLMRVFCKPGFDSVLITPPTYGMYSVSANVNDCGIIKVPLTPEFDLQTDEVINALDESVKLIFICSPGNPTAKSIPLEEVKKIASSKKCKGIVAVDEAYVDFNAGESAVSLLNSQYPNIVVMQTLSKAFGLAGIRLGFCIGHPDLIQLMNNVKAPYNVNSMTSEVARKALINIKVLEDNVLLLKEQRKFVAKSLDKLDFVTRVYPSDSNFILFRVKQKAYELYKTMADEGVVSRFRGNELHCNECIRVTVGTNEENLLFLQNLEKTYSQLTSQENGHV